MVLSRGECRVYVIRVMGRARPRRIAAPSLFEAIGAVRALGELPLAIGRIQDNASRTKGGVRVVAGPIRTSRCAQDTCEHPV